MVCLSDISIEGDANGVRIILKGWHGSQVGIAGRTLFSELCPVAVLPAVF
jgi:hypothetical protein